MEHGLQTSMWARIASHRTYDFDRHDTRSRSLPPPPMSGFAAPLATSTSTPGAHHTTTTVISASQSTPATKAGSLSRLNAFRRFEQAYRRVRWKCIDLGNSYSRALAPADCDFTLADAEINFKVDFHEFYAWIEQAVVFVLLVFGVSVQRGSSFWDGTRRGATNGPSHAYHHNVLKALEEEANPLYSILGHGDVHQALWEAKKLRNRWKDASEKETPPLKMYNLHWIVAQLLEGLEQAYLLAKEEVKSDLESGQGDGMAVDHGWEWMVESMDWEA